MDLGGRKQETMGVISIGDPDFPEKLKEIRCPPKKLLYKGRKELLQTPCIAVVGSRKSTPYGIQCARKIAVRAAENGITVVSGMARGIDTAAHKGALEAGGNTIAVFGCGLDICYPKENRKLMKEIEEKGLLLSEYEEGIKPHPGFFPARNRIIAGISDAVVICEAGYHSGALNTAEHAADQGKSVLAVPGNITNPMSIGTNKLIQDGAEIIVSPEDVFRGRTDYCPPRESEPGKDLGPDELEIYRLLLERGEMTTDEIIRETMKSPSYVSGIVTILEMKGLAVTSMGRVFIE